MKTLFCDIIITVHGNNEAGERYRVRDPIPKWGWNARRFHVESRGPDVRHDYSKHSGGRGELLVLGVGSTFLLIHKRNKC